MSPVGEVLPIEVPSAAVMGIAEIAAYLGVKRPNVRKTLSYYDVPPLAELAVGPVYSADNIMQLKRRRDADEARRQADVKRREAARARR